MTVTVNAVVAVVDSVTVRINHDDDDAEERLASGSVSTTSSDIELVVDRGRPQCPGPRRRSGRDWDPRRVGGE